MSEKHQIPFLDLIRPHTVLREELAGVLITALNTAGFIGGPMVDTFERQFAEFCDVTNCVGVGSGTDALRFALIAAGVGEGDIVVTVPNTFIATTEAISQAGARPVFVDIDEGTYNMDPRRLQAYLEEECYFDGDSRRLVDRELGKRVAAIVPVHLYGQTADMDSILDLAQKFKLMVIEDACQAHGAEYFSQKDACWKKAGSMGLAAAFSFYPGKNLGACGEAGAVTTNDAELARKIRMLRDHGQSQKYYHDMEGYNGRLDAIQAGMLSVKLNYLADWNEQRRNCARQYRELLASTDGVVLPEEPVWSNSVYHLFVVRVEDRERLQRELASANIGTAIHYPVPLHLQRAYARLGYHAGRFPVAERCAREIVSLPMFPGLSQEDVKRVAEGVQACVSRATPQQVAVAAVSAGD